jgi:hypothetical protein
VDVVQAAHAPAAQIGVAAGQVALVKHCTHLFVVASQSGIAPEHVVLSTHGTHAPVAPHAIRAGSPSPAHWADVAQATHVPAVEQIGVAAGQVALVWHCGMGLSAPPVVSALLASMVLLASMALLSTDWPASTNLSQPGTPSPSHTQIC